MAPQDSKRAEDKLKLMRQDVQNLYSLAKGTAWEAAGKCTPHAPCIHRRFPNLQSCSATRLAPACVSFNSPHSFTLLATVPYIINARVAWILFTIRMERTGQRVVAAVKPWVAATHAQALQLHFTNVEAVQEQVVARLPERLREAVTRLHVQQGLFLVYSGLAAGLLSVMLRRIA